MKIYTISSGPRRAPTGSVTGRQSWAKRGAVSCGVPFLLMLLALPAFGQTPAKVTVADQLFEPDGTFTHGTITVTSAQTFTSVDGFVIPVGQRVIVPISGTGTFSVALVPNAGSTPAGTFYTADYNTATQRFTEIWVIPGAGPVRLINVRTSPAPSPTITFPFTQMTPPVNCFSLGGFVQWNGTSWTCSSSSGGVGSLQTSGIPNLSQTAINFIVGATVNGLTITPSNTIGGGATEQFAISGTLTDAGLASNYSGIGSCPANQYANAFTRNAAPGCAQVTYAQVSGTPQLAQTLGNSLHKWVNSYTASTGIFTQTQPDYSDLTGIPATFAPTAHNLLSTAHGDTVAAAAVRGDMIAAEGVSATWQRVAHGGTGTYPKWNGTDIVASTLAASGVGACGANLFASTLVADAVPTCTQVSFANLSGSAVMGQLPALGTGTKVASTSAVAPASNKCVEFDISGNLVVAGINAACGSGGSSAWSGITASTNANAGSFLATGNSWDWTGTTIFKLRVGAGLTTTANGDVGYDTTNKNWHMWGNAVDNINIVLPASISPANNDCAKFTVAAGVITLNTAGAACGAGGAPSFPVTVAGTVTSGGIPYFSSATVESSSAVLSLNGVVLGGGAGGAPTVTAADSTTTHALFATAGAPAFRAIAAGDIPTLNQSTTGTAAALTTTPTTCGAGIAAIGILANGNATGCFTPAGAGTVTHTAGALTAGQLLVGNAAADITVGNLTGDVTTSGATATTVAKIQGTTVTVISPATGQTLAFNGSAFLNGYPGIGVDATNPATLLSTDRGNYLLWTTGATLTLPAASGAFASNLPFVIKNNSGGTLALTPTTPNNIDGGTAQAPLSVLNNFAAFVYQDNTPNWWAIRLPTFTAFGATCLTAHSWSTTTGFACLPGTSGGIPYFSAANTWASSAALTANMPVIGGGAGIAPSVGTITGNTTQFATWTGATTAARCVHTDASGNLTIAAADCGSGGGSVPTGTGFYHITAGVMDPAAYTLGYESIIALRTTAITATTLVTPTADSLWNVKLALNCNSVVATATMTPTITYTDPSSTVHTVTGNAGACATLGSASVTSQDITFFAKSGVAIQYSVAVANSPSYQGSVTALPAQGGAVVAGGGAGGDPNDVTTLILDEEFNGGSGGTSGQVGTLGWGISTIGAVPVASQVASTFPNLGITQLLTSAVSGQGGCLSLSPGGTQAPLGDLKTNTGWTATWIFRLSTTSTITAFIGLANNNTTLPPTNGMWVRYDTNQSDAAFKVENRAASTSTVGGTTYTVDTAFHKIVISSTVSGSIVYTFDANTPQTLSTNAPTVSMMPLACVVTQTTAAENVQVDAFKFKIVGLTR